MPPSRKERKRSDSRICLELTNLVEAAEQCEHRSWDYSLSSSSFVDLQGNRFDLKYKKQFHFIMIEGNL